MLRVGRNLENDEDVYIDDSKSRVIVVCGKRGSGKSYSMGTLAEELVLQGKSLAVVVDPMGIFHTMSQPNEPQNELLWSWGMNAKGFATRLLVPGNPVERYGGEDVIKEMEKRDVEFKSLELNPSDVSPEGWCETFGFGVNDPMGIAITKAHLKCKKKWGNDFFIPDLIDVIGSDSRAGSTTKDALSNKLEIAQTWGMFSEGTYRSLLDVLSMDHINVLDLSVIHSGRYGRRPLFVATLVRDLFARRSIARRREELELSSDVPRIWLFIDEAHQFAPSGKSSLAKEGIIRWVKEGRQPGLSMVIASQQPSALDMEVLSQWDVILSHSMTTRVDKSALNALTKDYMGSELKVFIEKIARTGEAVFVDDFEERSLMIKVAPRRSRPGGSE
jgi:hypothetical protein